MKYHANMFTVTKIKNDKLERILTQWIHCWYAQIIRLCGFIQM